MLEAGSKMCDSCYLDVICHLAVDWSKDVIIVNVATVAFVDFMEAMCGDLCPMAHLDSFDNLWIRVVSTGTAHGEIYSVNSDLLE